MKSILAVGLTLLVLGTVQVTALPLLGASLELPLGPSVEPAALTVMTRDLETGAGPRRVAEPFDPSPDSLSRARALAEEIQQARPHLIGLQQVTELWRPSSAEAVPHSSLLPVLLGELAARGLHYREVARVRGADREVPPGVGGAGPPGGSPGGSQDGLRLVESDVILARADVGVSQERAGTYQARREVSLPRGWVSVRAEVEGRRYRFVSTRLEPAPDEAGLRVQLAQAQELMNALRGETLPVVLVGDFNTPANLGRVGAPTYRELLLAGYVDVWTRRPVDPTLDGAAPDGPGSSRPTPELAALAERFHLVLVRGPVSPVFRGLGPVLAYAVGGLSDGERPGGPWRTDAAGMVARLLLPGAPRH